MRELVLPGLGKDRVGEGLVGCLSLDSVGSVWLFWGETVAAVGGWGVAGGLSLVKVRFRLGRLPL